MIQRTPTRIEAHLADDDRSWQQLLSESITSPEVLLERLELAPERWLAGARAGHELFPVRVPEPFLNRINKSDPEDPLLKQVLPLDQESLTVPGFMRDPLEEGGAIQTTGLIRKYRSRALLMVTGQCAINCRYCFRRHFPYEDQRLSPEDRQHVIDTLSASPEINEVILSGGDPLAVNDRLLAQWASDLSAIPHIRRLRLHTRLPVVIPQRVCDALLNWLAATPVQVIMVLHINHPAEIDDATRRALGKLRAAGVTLLNQSVILRGVNNDPDVLEALSETLFDAGVLPYYLHAFDPVEGAHHYDVADEEARNLVQVLLARLPGFLVPKLVREVPGREGKSPINLFP
ncbi:EF-P beta-lysylation protein EpmB [Marinobacter sp. M216]|uniref:L-lysine 2,3-aminomutase n=1 Tax=Marinobacter albus TaxID=3030833 RepID=A0ABT7H9W1_9GAMM|nr:MULTISPECIES: EF-P beta-lysylation protein EpmB [unclassified Marinobacter]MBW7470600.1 EF-P beta-lysylation protein EpmB [Marinobacter sp. F4218]MDK9557132.1 EF-P beta-lysylation protein EpmB [Marinobacter sp. M216]